MLSIHLVISLQIVSLSRKKSTHTQTHIFLSCALNYHKIILHLFTLIDRPARIKLQPNTQSYAHIDTHTNTYPNTNTFTKFTSFHSVSIVLSLFRMFVFAFGTLWLFCRIEIFMLLLCPVVFSFNLTVAVAAHIFHICF